MTMQGRIIDGVIIISDVYEPAEASERRPSRTLRIFLILAALFVVGGGLVGWVT